MLLKASDVGVRLGSRDVLSGVDLALEAGETVAVLGPSGVGKTTLLACLGGLRIPTTGTITVLGHEVSAMRSSLRARFRLANVGFVYQHALSRVRCAARPMGAVVVTHDSEVAAAADRTVVLPAPHFTA